ncbi:transcription repressor OFP17-like [Quillaja saponaria]|uniref:Transcription repressor OFP17-like n=1 Tax=Quillaja saponaria TaxID=32244 RepID=A0AAD7PLU1_QUISA|nr:transcription repressor OFP17-like [Quillaja saponaria]
MDRVRELRSTSNGGHEAEPLLFPSPLTPAYLRASSPSKSKTSGQEDVEEACRSFENYLVEMVVEEGTVRDLMDVEELLYCWKNLKCPVYTDLVCRFYGELCKDLFSSDGTEVDNLSDH